MNRRVGAGWRQIRYGRSLVCPILDGSSLFSSPLGFVASPRGLNGREEEGCGASRVLDRWTTLSLHVLRHVHSTYSLFQYSVRIQITCKRCNYPCVIFERPRFLESQSFFLIIKLRALQKNPKQSKRKDLRYLKKHLQN